MQENDLVLCKDIDCPLRMSCVRFIRQSEPNSIFYEDSPRIRNSQECKEFVSWYKTLEVIPKKLKTQASTRDIIKKFKEEEKGKQKK